MARTIAKYTSLYLDGYDLSGDAKSIGTLGWGYEDETDAAFNWTVSGTLAGLASVDVGPINGIFNNSAGAIHAVTGTAGTTRKLMYALGMGAAPSMGSPVFMWPVVQSSYEAVPAGNLVTVTAKLASDASAGMVYDKPWGNLLHALSTETGANAANTNVDNGGATTAGGWLMYQITAFTGTGSATISIDDSANGTVWAALSGATSGAVAHTSMPTAGIVQLSTTATVRQYLRWQLSLTGLTNVSFTLAFVRR